jgi:hypothetical protein
MEFCSADHVSMMTAARAEMRLRKLSNSDANLASILSSISTYHHQTIKRRQHTGAWLSALSLTINGMELSAQEFRDAISM